MTNLKEKLILKEEDILPPAELEEPIVVEEEPVVEPEVKDLGFATMLNDLIKRTYENIDAINSTIVTLADLCEDEEKCNQVKEVLGTILDDEHLHIGQLQKVSELFSDSVEKIEDGQEEVKEVINDEVK